MLLASTGWKPGMLLKVLRSTRHPLTIKNVWAKNVSSARVRRRTLEPTHAVMESFPHLLLLPEPAPSVVHTVSYTSSRLTMLVYAEPAFIQQPSRSFPMHCQTSRGETPTSASWKGQGAKRHLPWVCVLPAPTPQNTHPTHIYTKRLEGGIQG